MNNFRKKIRNSNLTTFSFRGAIATAQAAGWICEYASCKTKSWVLNIQGSKNFKWWKESLFSNFNFAGSIPKSQKACIMWEQA